MTNKKKILIVEDESLLRDALRDKLLQAGFFVIEANNGEDGLKLALKEHPDLILLDIVMPKMDGITAMTILRKDGWGKNADVIMLTSISDMEKIAESLEQGSYDYLIKSDWKIDDVVKRVNGKLK